VYSIVELQTVPWIKWEKAPRNSSSTIKFHSHQEQIDLVYQISWRYIKSIGIRTVGWLIAAPGLIVAPPNGGAAMPDRALDSQAPALPWLNRGRRLHLLKTGRLRGGRDLLLLMGISLCTWSLWEWFFFQHLRLLLEQLGQHLGLLLEQLGQQHLGCFVRTAEQQHLDCF
jgi:hypothetical protein